MTYGIEGCSLLAQIFAEKLRKPSGRIAGTARLKSFHFEDTSVKDVPSKTSLDVCVIGERNTSERNRIAPTSEAKSKIFSSQLNFFFFLRITRVVFLKVSTTTAVQESRNRNIRYR